LYETGGKGFEGANKETILNLEKLIMRSADYSINFLSVGRRMSAPTCKEELP
jgi:hypothetical protein